MSPRESADASGIGRGVNIRVIITGDSFIGEARWKTGFGPAGVIRTSISALKIGLNIRRSKRQCLTGVSIAQGIREYWVMRAFRKVFNDVLM